MALGIGENRKDFSEEYEKLPLDAKFRYLAQKLNKHTNHDIMKCVLYWNLLIKLPYDKAPHEHMETYKLAKMYIKKY